MKCPHCGFEDNKPHQKKCSLCGQPLDEVPVEVEQPVNDTPVESPQQLEPEPVQEPVTQPSSQPDTWNNGQHDSWKSDQPDTWKSGQSNSWGGTQNDSWSSGGNTAPQSRLSPFPPVGGPVKPDVPEPTPTSADRGEEVGSPENPVVFDYDDEPEPDDGTSQDSQEGPIGDSTPSSSGSSASSWLIPLVVAILSLAVGAILYLLT